MPNSLCSGGGCLQPGASLTSQNGIYTLTMEPDGSLVAAKNGVPYSSIVTHCPGDCLMVSPTGVLEIVSLNPDGSVANVCWTDGFNPLCRGACLWVQDDGNITIRTPPGNPNGTVVWQTGVMGPLIRAAILTIAERVAAAEASLKILGQQLAGVLAQLEALATVDLPRGARRAQPTSYIDQLRGSGEPGTKTG